MNNKFEYSDIKKTKEEILFAIKERVNEITSGDLQNPVYLKTVTVYDSVNSVSGSVKYFNVQCVFYDERGRLCGDMLGAENRREKNVIFGRFIEEFDIEGLRTILNSLYGRDWYFDGSNSIKTESNIKNRILFGKLPLKNFLAGKIRLSLNL